ncbi:SdrD B-like domain-containing protein [Candidatus Viridilinea mediisalina]|nr:SdrD B-like domain-containing protein [Candidatus Viridilinea mediisalina]
MYHHVVRRRSPIAALLVLVMFALAGLAALLPVSTAYAQGPILNLRLELAPGTPTDALPSGEVFTVRLTYECSSSLGANECNDMVVTSTLPPEFEGVAVQGNNDVTLTSYDPDTQVATWTFRSPLPLGTTGQLDFEVRYVPGTTLEGTEGIISAEISGTGATPVESTITPPPATAEPQPELTKSLVAGGANDDLSLYSVNLCAGTTGALNLTNSTITDTLPLNAVYISSSPEGVFNPLDRTIVWSDVNVPATGTGCRSFDVVVSYPGTNPANIEGAERINEVAASTTPYSGTLQSLTSSVTHTLAGPLPGLGFNKSVTGAEGTADTIVGVGGEITTRLRVDNTGNVGLNNIRITDTIPLEYSVFEVNTGQATSVDYQRNDDGVWISGVPLGATVEVTSFPSWNAGDYVSHLRFNFATLPLTQTSQAVSFRSIVINPPNGGGAAYTVTADGPQMVENTATARAFHGIEPLTQQSSAATVEVAVPKARPDPRKTIVSGSPALPGGTVRYEVRLRNGAFAPLFEPTIADLLPPQVTDPTNFEVTENIPGCLVDPNFEQIDNYNGSGRTMLIWSWADTGCSIPSDGNARIRFDVTVVDGTRAGNYANYLALVNHGMEPNLVRDGLCQPAPSDAGIFQNGDGIDPSRLCFSSPSNLTVRSIASIGSAKYVAGQLDVLLDPETGEPTDLDFHRDPRVGQTVQGGLIYYRMTLENTGNIDLTNLQIIDILPFSRTIGLETNQNLGVRDQANVGTAWTVQLGGPVIVDPEIPGLEIRYSSELNPCRDEFTVAPNPDCMLMVDGDLPGPGVWSLEMPSDPTAVRSLRFDFGDYILDPTEELTFYFQALAPVDAPLAGPGPDGVFGNNDDTNVAWNTFAYTAERGDDGSTLVAQPPRVGITVSDTMRAAYGNYVWHDINRDGIQNDGSASGMNGVVVTLYMISGTEAISVARQFTRDDSNGNPGYYLFSDLDPGDYFAEFSLPEGFTVTVRNAGGNPLLDSDIFSDTLRTITTTLTAGQTDLSWDAGFVSDDANAVSIGNRVFFDTNNDGFDNDGDGSDGSSTGIPNVTVQLFLDADGNGFLTGNEQTPIATTTTDLEGYYIFTRTAALAPLAPGQYIVGIPPSQFDPGGPLEGYHSSHTRIDEEGRLRETAAQHPSNNDDWDDNGRTVRFVSTDTLHTAFDVGFRFYNGGVLSRPIDLTGDQPTDEFHPDADPGDPLYDPNPDNRSNLTIDFGFYTASLGDLVWIDNGDGDGVLADGIRNGTEPVTQGVVVRLLSSDNTVLMTTTTNASGIYSFTGLAAGDYFVEIDIPEGFVSTRDTANTADPNSNVNDHDKGVGTDPGTARTNLFELRPGVTAISNTVITELGSTYDPTIDFGIVRYYSLGNRVWHDTNNNGIHDDGEAGINGVRVRLWEVTSSDELTPALHINGTLVATQTTDANGYYRFDNLFAGDYVVEILAENFEGTGALRGYRSSTGPLPGLPLADVRVLGGQDREDDGFHVGALVRSGTITLGGDDGVSEPTGDDDPTPNPDTDGGEAPDNQSNRTVDFGFIPIYSLGNRVWYDADNSGHINDADGDNPGIPGVVVRLLNADGVTPAVDVTGTEVPTQTTDANGYYRFDNLFAGDYIVEVVADNFSGDGPLVNHFSSTGPQEKPDPNSNNDDNRDNGLNTPVDGAIRSGIVTLGSGDGNQEPTNDNDPTTNPEDGESRNDRSNRTVDFGFVEPISLGNRVFYDTNNDRRDNDGGGANGSSTGIPGVRVLLYLDEDRSGDLDDDELQWIAEATTDANGFYLFTAQTHEAGSELAEPRVLLPGSYQIVIPADQFEPGGPLFGYHNSGVTINNAGQLVEVAPPTPPNNDQDHFDKGSLQTTGIFNGGVATSIFSVTARAMPTGEPEGAGTAPGGIAILDENSDLTIDFGFYTLSLGNLVWIDNGEGGGTLADGIRNGDEPGMPNVPVRLLSANGSQTISNTVTDANGIYTFTGLVSGTYRVEIDIPEGFVSSRDTDETANPNGNVDDHDKGVGSATDTATSEPFNLTPGSEGAEENNDVDTATGSTYNPTLDFAVVRHYSLGNRVWEDTDNDGIHDLDTEAGIADVVVRLWYGDGTTPARHIDGSLVEDEITDANGYYRFDNLAAGDYVVEIIADNFTGNNPLRGFLSSTGFDGANNPYEPAPDPDNDVDLDDNGTFDPISGGVRSLPVTLGGGNGFSEPTGDDDPDTNPEAGEAPDNQSNRTVDFGFVPLYSLGNRVWYDVNNSGDIDDADGSNPGIGNVVVRLLDDEGNPALFIDGTPVPTQTTNDNGYYRFDNLGAGNYIVEIVADNFTGDGPLVNYFSSTGPNVSTNANDGTDSNDKGMVTMGDGAIRSGTVNLGPGNSEPDDDNDPITNPEDGESVNERSNRTIDFGFYRPVAIGNQVWYDTNNNGILDDGEVGIPGVRIELFYDADNNGTIDPAEQTPIAVVTTSITGTYLFTQHTNLDGSPLTTTRLLTPGRYQVGIPASEFAPGGPLYGLYSSGTFIEANGTISESAAFDPMLDPNDGRDRGTLQTTGFYTDGVLSLPVIMSIGGEPVNEDPSVDPHPPYRLDNSSNQTIDFGFYAMSLGNLVWLDDGAGVGGVVNDGIRQPTERGLLTVTVRLFAANGTTLLSTTTTDSDGRYLFTGLVSGTYIVEVDTNSGEIATLGLVSSRDPVTANTPSSDDNDDNGTLVTSTTVRSVPVTLVPGTLPTLESDQSLTRAPALGMGDPRVLDHPLTPDNNSNLHVDFGFAPADWGDLPDSTITHPDPEAPPLPVYNTRREDNGPRHAIRPGLLIGSTVDADANGQPHWNALGDLPDEDGVTFPTFYTGLPADVTVVVSNTTGTTATLYGFIDFDRNGDFDGENEAVSIEVPSSPDPFTAILTFNVPHTAVFTETVGARFRLSTDTGLGPDGYASDGEVEDYMVSLGEVIPTYSLGNRVWRDLNNNGFHDADAGETGIDDVLVRLTNTAGTTVTDVLGNPVPDQLTRNGGYYRFDYLISGTYRVEILPVNFDEGQPLYGLYSSTGIQQSANPNNNIDRDDNGLDDPNPRLNGIRSGDITLGPDNSEPTGETDLEPNDPNPEREAPDGRSNLTVDFGFVPADWGDLPQGIDGLPSYNTTLENDGPRHVIHPDLRMGTEVQPNVDGDPHPNAAAHADDDGVTLPTFYTGQTANVVVTVTNNLTTEATLYGFIDFNGDGRFDGPGEVVTVNVPAGSDGITTTLSFNVPMTATFNSDLGARFRLSTDPALGPDGYAPNGEVEDYLIQVVPTYSLGNRVWRDDNNDGLRDDSEPGIANVVVRLLDDNGTPLLDSNGLEITTTTNISGYYRFDNLLAGDYIVEVVRENFAVGQPLEGLFSSTGLNQSATPNNNRDDDDNGIDDPSPWDNGIRSGIITLGDGPGGANEPENGDVASPNPPGEAPDDRTNLTVDFGFVPSDWGDLPQGTGYNTTLENDGPRHVIHPDLRIGAEVQPNLDGQPDDNAAAHTDDDGVTFPTFFTGLPANVVVTVTNNLTREATLYGFIDFNGDGRFDGPGEVVTVTVPAERDGITTTLEFTVPMTATFNSDLGARFRLSTDPNLGPDGYAPNGEVEDYLIQVVPTYSLGNRVWYDRDNSGDITPADGVNPGLDNVWVRLLDENGNRVNDATGNQVPDQQTSNGGYYRFDNLPAGEYIVELIAENFADGAPFDGYRTSTGPAHQPNPNVPTDSDDNGIAHASGSIRSGVINLGPGANEPEGESDRNPDPSTDAGESPDDRSNLTVDFGLFTPVRLGDLIFHDRDNNGLFDPAVDSPLPGSLVELFLADGITPARDITDTLVLSQTTLADGSYLFPNLRPGGYVVRVTPPDGFVSSTDITTTLDPNNNRNNDDNGLGSGITGTVQSNVITLTSGLEPVDDGDTDPDSNLTLDFGFYRPLSLGNLIFIDNNNDGLYDPDVDEVLPGALVELFLADGTTPARDITGTLVLSQTTLADGLYLFENLPPGDYVVRVTPPTGYISSDDITTTADPSNNLDNDDNGIGSGSVDGSSQVSSAVVQLRSESEPDGPNNDVNLRLDFGFFQAVAVGNQVWYDTNNDGLLNNGEVGIPNVRVELFYDADRNGTIDGAETTPIAVVTTSITGTYLFTQHTNLDGSPLATPRLLNPGSYVVGIPASQFESGGSLHGLFSSGTFIGANGVRDELPAFDPMTERDDGLDRGTLQTSGFYEGGVLSALVTLEIGEEPTDELPNVDDHPEFRPDNNSNQTIDFGFYGMSLGNLVWLDDGRNGGTANDGLRQANEPGIAGVTVRLFAADGTTELASTLTDGTGRYLFTGLVSGTYIVEVDRTSGPMPGLASSRDPVNANDPSAEDNDDNGVIITANTVRSVPVTLVPGQLPTEEEDQDETQTTGMGNPVQRDHPNTPDENSNLHVDFGFVPVDWGDLPPPYNTLDADGGPNHGITPDLRMGATVLPNLDGNPHPNANHPEHTDDDGVTFPTFYTGLPAEVTVRVYNQTGRDAILYGFIDFNGDGRFDGPGEVVTTTVATGSDGTTTLTFTVPMTATFGSDLGARFRLSTDTGLGPDGTATDGEVEDYLIEVVPTYSLGNRVWLDENNDGWRNNDEPGINGVTVRLLAPNGNRVNDATGSQVADQVTSSGGYYRFDNLLAGDYIVEVVRENFAAGQPLHGRFSSTGAGQEANPNLDGDDNDNGIVSTTPATTGIRSGIVTLGNDGGASEPLDDNDAPEPNPPGEAPNNRSNRTVDFGFAQADWGDLPQPRYNTTAANNGPHHLITEGLLLGATIDAERDGQPNASATGDDNTGINDEDGVFFPTFYTGLPAEVVVTVTNLTGRDAFLYGFIDFNGNGDFNGPGETQRLTIPSGADGEEFILTFNVPMTATFDSDLGARFRLSTDPNLGPDGYAPDGEVEDYIIRVAPTYSLGNRVWYDRDNSGHINANDEPNFGRDGVIMRLLDEDGNRAIDATGNEVPDQTTSDGGYYRFDNLPEGRYIVEVIADNFTVGAALAGFSTSTGPNHEADPNVRTDSVDNGIEHGSGSVRSGVVVLGPGANEPTGEDRNPNPAADAGEAPDNRSNLMVDFGFTGPLSLGNQIFHDRDNDGRYDPEVDTPLAGALVELIYPNGNQVTDVFGNPVQPQTTGVTGTYLFQDLWPGDYVVRVTPPEDFRSSDDVEGITDQPNNNDDHYDKGIGSSTTGTVQSNPITLNAGTEPDFNGYGNLRMDFGFYRPLSLGDLVFHDRDNNGRYDPAVDSPLAGATVELLDREGNAVTDADGNAVGNQTTGEDGLYRFNNLKPGDYVVRVTPPESFRSSDDISTSANPNNNVNNDDNGIGSSTSGPVSSNPITLTSGDEPQEEGYANLTLDFGFFRPLSLGEFIFEDFANNGVFDPDRDLPLPGATVELLLGDGSTPATDVNGNPVPPQTTDANGNYRFENLRPGDYVVRVTAPQGYESSTDIPGVTNNPNNDINLDNNGLGTGRTASSSPITLRSEQEPDGNFNDANLRLDFGFFRPSTIGDRVWLDLNKDGVQDANETTGVPGVRVTLYAADGTTVLSTTTTDENGYYRFERLGEGEYVVGFDLPPGYERSPTGGTDDRTRDSDADNSTGRTPVISLPPGTTDLTWDAGLFFTGSLGDRVWFDRNANGIQDADEQGIPGVTVRLYAGDGTTLLATTTTDENGFYTFPDLGPGEYIIEFVPPTGYHISPPNQGDNRAGDSDPDPTTRRTGVITLEPGGNDNTWDAGLYERVRIGNFVWDDINNNGLLDADEMGIPNVEVRLYRDSNGDGQPDGDAIATTRTNAQGFYLFDNLVPGSYIVEIVAPEGYVSSTGVNGSRTGPYEPAPNTNIDDRDRGTQHDGNIIRSGTITIWSREAPDEEIDGDDSNGNMTVDFGLFRPAAIGNIVWFDRDGNGRRDEGEEPAVGVLVSLVYADGTPVLDSSGQPIRVRTNENGEYLFDYLTPGNYRVVFSDLPEGYNFTTPGLDSDANPLDGQSDVVTLQPGDRNMSVWAGLINPTAIALIQFTATAQGDSVLLRWATADERDTWAFHLWRSADGNRANAERITPQRILARGGPQLGASYSWVDSSATQGVRYSYWLEEIETNGRTNEYGPITVTSGLSSGEFRVLLPLVVR